MTFERPSYLAYMLRLWRVPQEGGPAWRASLEDPHTGEVRNFASLEELIQFLKERTLNVEEKKIGD